jgi:hypothetical protein
LEFDRRPVDSAGREIQVVLTPLREAYESVDGGDSSTMNGRYARPVARPRGGSTPGAGILILSVVALCMIMRRELRDCPL